MLRIVTIGDTEFELEDADLIIKCGRCDMANQTSLGEDFEVCFGCGHDIFLDSCMILEHSKQ